MIIIVSNRITIVDGVVIAEVGAIIS